MGFSFNNVTGIVCKEQPNSNITNLERIGVDAIYHILENSCEDGSTEGTSFEKDAELTKWDDNHCVSVDDITRVEINGVTYVFKYICINTLGQAIVVVINPTDVWDKSDEELIEDLGTLDEVKFEVSYK